MLLALKQAYKSIQEKQVPVGCIFVNYNNQKQYQIISQAHNKTNQSKNATLHCQIICIKQIQNKYPQYSFEQTLLFVTCQPCIMCAYALKIIGIKKVYFGCYNKRFGGNGSILNINLKSYDIEGNILPQQCKSILKQFYEQGNQSLPQQKRHRKSKINTKQQSLF